MRGEEQSPFAFGLDWRACGGSCCGLGERLAMEDHCGFGGFVGDHGGLEGERREPDCGGPWRLWNWAGEIVLGLGMGGTARMRGLFRLWAGTGSCLGLGEAAMELQDFFIGETRTFGGLLRSSGDAGGGSLDGNPGENTGETPFNFATCAFFTALL